MPKVVVYVSAGAWRELESEGRDPAEYIRKAVRENLARRKGDPVEVVADAQPRDVPARTVTPDEPSSNFHSMLNERFGEPKTK